MVDRSAVLPSLLALICDTNVVYGALVRGDRDHGRCARLLADSPETLVVPAPVVVELDWLARTRSALRVTDVVLGSIEDGSLEIEQLTSADYTRIRELCRDYESLPLGLVDASVVAVAERLLEPKIATLDRRHFSVVRPRHVRAFTLLPD